MPISKKTRSTNKRSKTGKTGRSDASRKAVKKTRRKRRTEEEIIAELQEKIQAVRKRATVKEAKKSPAFKAAFAALKALDRALDVAATEEETLMRHALAQGRKPLAEFLTSKGLQLPKANLPRGRKPKA